MGGHSWKLMGPIMLLAVLLSASSAHAFRTSYAPRPGKIIQWGQPGDLKATGNPPEGSDFIAVSAGKMMAMALRTDGRAVLWGHNHYNSFEELARAQDAKAFPSNWQFIRIACGREHWIGQRSDGSLVCGGGYEKGGKKALMKIPDILLAEMKKGRQVIDISAGGGFSLVLLEGSKPGHGSLYAWSIERNPWPVKNADGEDFINISTTNKQGGAALRADGSIAAFGWDNYGQATPPEGKGYLDCSAGGYKLTWMLPNHDVNGKGAWHGTFKSDPKRPFVALSIGYGLSSILRADGSVLVEGRTGPDKESIDEVEKRQDILAVTQGNGMGIGIVAVDGLPVWHEAGAGRVRVLPRADNAFPLFESKPVTNADVGAAYSYQVQAKDPEGKPITCSLVKAPEGMTIDASTGMVRWTASQPGKHIVVIKISDGTFTATQPFWLTVGKSGG